MGIINTLHFITNHPLNKSRKITAIKRWLQWQIGSRLVPGAIAVNFVNKSTLLVQPGMTGATGNIYTGLHEFEDMSFMLHLLRKGDLFVDVGANIGSYTILASAVVNSRSISIEPIPKTFQNLKLNINLNDIKHAVNAMNIGVGEKDEVLRFTNTLDSNNHMANESEARSIDTIEVAVSTLDKIIGDLEPILIKIDVEGFEANVIAGAKSVLCRGSLDAVIMELNHSNSYGNDLMKLHQRMLNYGFTPFTYDPFKRILMSVDKINEKTGNAIYVRNFNRVRERLITASPFYINEHEI